MTKQKIDRYKYIYIERKSARRYLYRYIRICECVSLNNSTENEFLIGDSIVVFFLFTVVFAIFFFSNLKSLSDFLVNISAYSEDLSKNISTSSRIYENVDDT